ncbi:MAG TPA: DUF5034 domain-containing protein [Chitinophagaceae bacterium]|nr:DUF5034 domain-containing protein [Chitinophagaceae bacterium]
MKTTIQKSLFIALCYYAALMAGCIKDQCNCPPVKNGKFNYTELNAANLSFTIQSDTAFSSKLSTADTVEQGQYGFRLHFDYKILACSAPKRSSWINAAYACDCALSQFYIVDSITGISIRTLTDLDATYLSGSDVTDYFKALEYSYTPQKIVYYNALTSGQLNGPHDPSMTGIVQRDLYLKTAVPGNRELAFEISVTFASGNKMKAQTKPVFLK